MPSWEALITFTIASLLLIVVPGPSVLFVIGRSLALGRQAGFLSVVGNELGGLVPVAAVAFGVGGIVAKSVVLFTLVKMLGAAYLAYLGVQAIRHRNDGLGHAANTHRTQRTGWLTVRQGFIVGATNPKTIVFFVAALPQFVSFSAGGVAAQMMVLGLAFTIIAFLCDSIWALLAGTARGWLASSPTRVSRIRTTGGGLMIGLAGTLAFTGNKG